MVGLAVAVATYFRGVIQQNAKIHTLELQMNTTETRFNVFWAVIEKELPKVLIKPHQPEIDAYLRRMHRGEKLTEQEKLDMKEKMKRVLDGDIDGNEDSGLKLGYALLIARIESEVAVVNKEGRGRREQEAHEEEGRRRSSSGGKSRWF